MITAIQGLQPIVITAGNKLQAENEGQRNSGTVSAEASAAQKKSQAEEKKRLESVEKKEKEKNGKPDFSNLEKIMKSSFDLDSVTFKFSIDEETKDLVLKVLDSDTNEVVRQIPSELAMKIARFVVKQLDSGQVTDAKV